MGGFSLVSLFVFLYVRFIVHVQCSRRTIPLSRMAVSERAISFLLVDGIIGGMIDIMILGNDLLL